MALDTIPKQEGGKLKAVASGTLPSGQPVVVNADGTVSVVSETTVSEDIGSPTIFESGALGNYNPIASTFDSSNNKVVLAYQDDDNSDYGTAIVGTVSGNSISFGSPVVFNTGQTTEIHSTFDSSNNKVVICYKNDSATENGTAIVGTVSGTSISFGTAAEFETSDAANQAIVFDSNSNRVVIIYRDGNNSNYGTATVCTISGTSISFNTPVVFASSNLQRPGAGFDSTNNKIVIAYQDTSNSNKGTAIVGTVSGTSISFGSSAVFDQGALGSTDPAVVYDTNAQKIVIVYQDEYDSYKGAAVVGTVSGTSISFGTTVVFETGNANDISASYDSAAKKIVIAYRDSNNSNYGTVIVGTVSGTSISFNSPSVFEAADSRLCSTVFDSNSNKVVISYRDDGNSSQGTSLVYQTAYVSQNLTSENYIGMSGGAAFQTGSAASVGTAVNFNSGNTDNTAATFDSNSNKVVIAYRDIDSSQYGTAVVGTVDQSDNSISFGSEVVFESAVTSAIGMTFDSNSNKVVIVYKDEGGSFYGTAIVGTVSGTSISFGTPVVYKSATTSSNSATFDSNSNKVVVGYTGGAKVGTVSGTSISFGSETAFIGSSASRTSMVFDSNSNKVVISSRAQADDLSYAAVGTVSGTSISFGTAVQIGTGVSNSCISSVFDSNSNKVVIAFGDGSSSGQGTAVVGTVSGTSISFGSEVVFDTSAVRLNQNFSFDTESNKVVVAYKDNDNSNYLTFIDGTVSGTSISFGSGTAVAIGAGDEIGTVFDSNSKRTVSSTTSAPGKSVVYKSSSIATTRGEVADGDNATVDIVGTVSTNQVGLTAGQQYYVQTDGTIGETPADPSVLAGTAVSATKMVVKS